MNREDHQRHWQEVVVRRVFFFGARRAALAQSAQTTGRIVDSSSAVIIGAKITVTDVDTGVKRTATSNEDGYYGVPLLQEGIYRILVEMHGFKPIDRSGIKL